MTIHINVEFECEECERVLDSKIHCNVMCDDCLENHETVKIRDALLYCVDHDYIWKDRDCYSGCTEEEKTIYMKGVQKGFRDALFWMADHFNEVEYWEILEEKMK